MRITVREWNGALVFPIETHDDAEIDYGVDHRAKMARVLLEAGHAILRDVATVPVQLDHESALIRSRRKIEAARTLELVVRSLVAIGPADAPASNPALYGQAVRVLLSMYDQQIRTALDELAARP